MTVWHYTIGKRFAQIMADGVIKPATAHVPKKERPIVWFSLNEWWEPTARKMVMDPDGKLVPLDMMGTEKHGEGLVRIGVAPETAPYDWKTLRKTSGMSVRMARSLSRAATEMGASPSDWRGTFEAVPRSSWTAIETFQDGAWVPMQGPATQAVLSQHCAPGPQTGVQSDEAVGIENDSDDEEQVASAQGLYEEKMSSLAPKDRRALERYPQLKELIRGLLDQIYRWREWARENYDFERQATKAEVVLQQQLKEANERIAELEGEEEGHKLDTPQGYCTNCGRSRVPEACFCIYCGKQLEENLGGGGVRSAPKPDPLLESAGQLVDTARLLGISNYTEFSKELPIILELDTEQWDWVFTIASVFIAASRLNSLGVDGARKETILKLVANKLAVWKPDSIAGFEDCKAFFERTYDALAEVDEYKRDPRWLASDSIGAWMVWNLLQRPAFTDAERKLIRLVGGAATHCFFSFFDCHEHREVLPDRSAGGVASRGGSY